mgnify:CR=1 FL=1
MARSRPIWGKFAVGKLTEKNTLFPDTVNVNKADEADLDKDEVSLSPFEPEVVTEREVIEDESCKNHENGIQEDEKQDISCVDHEKLVSCLSFMYFRIDDLLEVPPDLDDLLDLDNDFGI